MADHKMIPRKRKSRISKGGPTEDAGDMGLPGKIVIAVAVILLAGLVAYSLFGNGRGKASLRTDEIPGEEAVKLYWFIPDGMRADPDVFDIYAWAEAGELPNIKRMMDEGSYGYSIPPFPGHTPVGFATLLTGTYPMKSGVADGPMRVEGKPLDKIAIGGFSSVAKKNDPIWTTLEASGREVVLISIPGSTPPELDSGMTVRGRWGGWGPDFAALNFETRGDLSQRRLQGRSARLFLMGPELTRYIDPKPAQGWSYRVSSYSDPLEAEMEGWGGKLYAYIFDSRNDSKVNYNRIMLSTDKRSEAAVLSEGQWSGWIPMDLKWGNNTVRSSAKVALVRIEDDGFFRIRVVYDTLNKHSVDPSEAASEFTDNVGPMVDFVDNFPPQLIYYPEDKQVFLDEMDMSFDWHRRAVPFVMEKYQPDVVIQDIYSPNQMLTSRWWMGYVDPASARYDDIDERERAVLWNEVKGMYKQLDAMMGQIMNSTDNNTIIVLSSDHGAIPFDRSVRLNNLFAEKGWLKFTIDNMTGEPIVDWKGSKVIFIQMDNIYIHPGGLGGNWTRASGEEYERLRADVILAIKELKDPRTGISPLEGISKWEDAGAVFQLPSDRVGDLVVANRAGYHWTEDMTADQVVFADPLISGYKQAVIPEGTKGMWTPFIIMGPGVKRGYRIDETQLVDQYPTIMHLIGVKPGTDVDGRVIEEIIE